MFNNKNRDINISLNTDNFEKKLIEAQNEQRMYAERKKADEERKAREEARKKTSEPIYGGIRHWVRNPLAQKPEDEINKVLRFSHNVRGKNITTHEFFPKNYDGFYNYINGCESEIDVDDYIKFISEQMTIMINSSDLDNDSKTKFLSLINNRDHKNEILTFVFILGLIVFCSIAPTCSALMLGGALAKGITLSIASAIVTFGPTLLVAAYMDPKPYFSTNSDEVRVPEAFVKWIKNIHNLAKNYKLPEAQDTLTGEEIINAIPVTPPSQTYRHTSL